jgi:hypothetical protein
MAIYVHNCFHWIGYHYVNYLLEKGKVIIGVDEINSDKKENLSMLIGRNSNFKMLTPKEARDEGVALVIGDISPSYPINAEKILQINVGVLKNKLQDAIVVNAPILFGEWMDMTENGVKLRNKIVPFDSEEFQANAIYIQDFVKKTYPLLNSSHYSSDIMVSTKKIFLDDAVKLENSIYIRDNIPIEENVKKLIAHYRRYKHFY